MVLSDKSKSPLSDYIERNLKPGSIKAKQAAISQAHAKFANFGKSDSQIEAETQRIQSSKQFLSISDTESEHSIANDLTTVIEESTIVETTRLSTPEQEPSKMQQIGSVEKVDQVESSAWETKSSSSDEEIDKTAAVPDTDSSSSSEVTLPVTNQQPGLVQNVRPDSESTETADLNETHQTSSWTLTCSSEGEVPQDERPTSLWFRILLKIGLSCYM